MGAVVANSKLLGKQKLNRNGQLMTVVGVRYKDNSTTYLLDIKFDDDTVVYDQSYQSYMSGTTPNPNKPYNVYTEKKRKLIGQTAYATNGQLMTIVDVEDGDKNGIVVVEFEDGFRKKVRYSQFRRGNVSNPNFSYVDKNRKDQEEKYVGRSNRAANGQLMVIVAYTDYDHIIVEFEDGVRVNTDMKAFLQGWVKNPTLEMHPTKYRNTIQRLHSTFITHQGLRGEVIEYDADNKQIKVRLENGFETYTRWNLRERVTDFDFRRKQYIGKTFKTKYGLDLTVLDCDTKGHILAKFEDGAVCKTSIRSVDTMRTEHPKLRLNAKKHFVYNNMVAKFIFQNDSDVYYACSCPKCGFDQILSAKEMLAGHLCDA